MAKGIPTTLKIYWEDGVTIETRYFPSRMSAEKYAKRNGYGHYITEDTSPFAYNRAQYKFGNNR